MSFTLLPAVDVTDGKAVRLVQGVAGTETDYGSPLESARQFQDHGADWVHLVDLDAAFDRGSNYDLLKGVIEQLSINVELSGGIRDDASLRKALDTGCTRVVIGTAATENPEWCKEIISTYGDKIAIGLDVQNIEGQWRLRGRGWVSDGGDLWEALELLDSYGCSRFVVTDVSKDGMLTGPNIQLLRDVAAATDSKIVASGGISTVDDIQELARYQDEGIDSAIIGKALYAGKFTLPEALEITAETQ